VCELSPTEEQGIYQVALSDIQRRIKRSKQAERNIGHWLQKNDGEDPRWKNIASSAGRVGHLTGLQFDAVSKTYAAESKQIKLPAKLLQFWIQIIDVAIAQGKEPLLYIEPTNVLVGMFRKKSPVWHVITEERHAELLQKERIADEAMSSTLERR
jgi:hypothetical protein